MKCYRSNCSCDDIKKMYCMYRITKQQHKLIAKISGNGCIVCGNATIASKYNHLDTVLCTSCGIVAIDDVVVRSCLINSRRVG